MKIWFGNPAMEACIYWNVVDGYAAFAPQGDMTAGENYYRGGLMRFDMTPKPAFHALHRLFHETWHTDETMDAPAGYASFRGFYGKYDCTISADGVEKTVPLHLTKKSGNRFRIVL